MLGFSIGAVLGLGALLAGAHFYSTLNFSEIAILLIIWVLLMAITVLACGFLGSLIMLLVGSTLTEEVTTSQQGAEITNVMGAMTDTSNIPTTLRANGCKLVGKINLVF